MLNLKLDHLAQVVVKIKRTVFETIYFFGWKKGANQIFRERFKSHPLLLMNKVLDQFGSLSHDSGLRRFSSSWPVAEILFAQIHHGKIHHGPGCKSYLGFCFNPLERHHSPKWESSL